MRVRHDDDLADSAQAVRRKSRASGRAYPQPASLLEPALFAHGRLLRRFEGSDAVRFSSRTALGILQHIETQSEGTPQILWDPFCGAGMIPCVALFAYAHKFDMIIASDVNPEAVRCAKENLRLFSAMDAFDHRLREVLIRQNANTKERRRWGEVAKYMERIRPAVLSQMPRLPLVQTFVGSALDLPHGIGGRVHFVADLPYGRQCELQGAALRQVIPAIRGVYPDATITFVMPREAREVIGVEGMQDSRWRALRKGRVILSIRA
jgi:hypothetical protein